MESAGTADYVDNAAIETVTPVTHIASWFESDYDLPEYDFFGEDGELTGAANTDSRYSQGNRLYQWPNNAHADGWPYGISHIGANGALRLGCGSYNTAQTNGNFGQNRITFAMNKYASISSIDVDLGVFYKASIYKADPDKEDPGDPTNIAYYTYDNYKYVNMGVIVTNGSTAATSTNADKVTTGHGDLVPSYRVLEEGSTEDATKNSAHFDLAGGNIFTIDAWHDESKVVDNNTETLPDGMVRFN